MEDQVEEEEMKDGSDEEEKDGEEKEKDGGNLSAAA